MKDNNPFLGQSRGVIHEHERPAVVKSREKNPVTIYRFSTVKQGVLMLSEVVAMEILFV